MYKDNEHGWNWIFSQQKMLGLSSKLLFLPLTTDGCIYCCLLISRLVSTARKSVWSTRQLILLSSKISLLESDNGDCPSLKIADWGSKVKSILSKVSVFVRFNPAQVGAFSYYSYGQSGSSGDKSRSGWSFYTSAMVLESSSQLKKGFFKSERSLKVDVMPVKSRSNLGSGLLVWIVVNECSEAVRLVSCSVLIVGSLSKTWFSST